jgi:hypothetical protein
MSAKKNYTLPVMSGSMKYGIKSPWFFKNHGDLITTIGK